MKKTIITGATGGLGKDIVASLAKQVDATNLFALVRDAAKAKDLESLGVNVRVGNYDDPDSLESALQGIDNLFFISASDIANRTAQHMNVLKAAHKTGVSHIYYTGFAMLKNGKPSAIDFLADPHEETEAWLKNSGITYTILKNGLYLDMLPMFAGENVVDSGTLFLPADEGKVSFALKSDLAEASVKVLTTDGHDNKEYVLTGHASSWSQIAQAISDASGSDIQYVSPSRDKYEQVLTDAGVPADYVNMFSSFAESMKQGELHITDGTLDSLLGRPAVSPIDFVEQVYQK